MSQTSYQAALPRDNWDIILLYQTLLRKSIDSGKKRIFWAFFGRFSLLARGHIILVFVRFLLDFSGAMLELAKI